MPLAGQIIRAGDLSRVVAKATDITANSASTSGTTPLDIITASAFTPPDTTRRYKITFRWRSIDGTVAGDNFLTRIQEGSTILSEEAHVMVGAGAADVYGNSQVHYVDGPTAAAHTYKGVMVRVAGTGTALMHGAATYPIQFVVEYVGVVGES